MCRVTFVELIKLKILLEFLLIDIIRYKNYKTIDISQFSFFRQILGPKMGLNDPLPLACTLYFGQFTGKMMYNDPLAQQHVK